MVQAVGLVAVVVVAEESLGKRIIVAGQLGMVKPSMVKPLEAKEVLPLRRATRG